MSEKSSSRCLLVAEPFQQRKTVPTSRQGYNAAVTAADLMWETFMHGFPQIMDLLQFVTASLACYPVMGLL